MMENNSDQPSARTRPMVLRKVWVAHPRRRRCRWFSTREMVDPKPFRCGLPGMVWSRARRALKKLTRCPDRDQPHQCDFGTPRWPASGCASDLHPAAANAAANEKPNTNTSIEIVCWKGREADAAVSARTPPREEPQKPRSIKRSTALSVSSWRITRLLLRMAISAWRLRLDPAAD